MSRWRRADPARGRPRRSASALDARVGRHEHAGAGAAARARDATGRRSSTRSSRSFASTRSPIRTMRDRGFGVSFRRCTTSRCRRRRTAISTTARRGPASAAIVSTRTRRAPTSRRSPTSGSTRNIRSKGPLGKLYPFPCCIHEGDTPSFLGSDRQRPRERHEPDLRRMGRPLRLAAVLRRDRGRSGRRAATRFPAATARATPSSAPTARRYTSDQATIWRWRTRVPARLRRAHGLDDQGRRATRITIQTSS